MNFNDDYGDEDYDWERDPDWERDSDGENRGNGQNGAPISLNVNIEIISEEVKRDPRELRISELVVGLNRLHLTKGSINGYLTSLSEYSGGVEFSLDVESVKRYNQLNVVIDNYYAELGRRIERKGIR